ncbi:MAG: adenylate/guanylate cyclase domain-containing protein [Dehalococcoidia bacterium]|nr:MAG: adenylate/guanylate cyclase domain-containing protein [Dehalococcoidia bacterium]
MRGMVSENASPRAAHDRDGFLPLQAGRLPREGSGVFVIWFDDIRGSMAMKEEMSRSVDEAAFQRLRKEHDDLVTEIITRDGEGQVIKSTGDGLLALFWRPSVAIERSAEIQERLHHHSHLSVRIGMDLGEVRFESDGARITDVFGRHVDWAARASQLADGGHVCCTRSVYLDAFSWITKTRFAWKEHGWYRVKPGEPPLEIFEPYNANVVAPMSELHGDPVPYGIDASPTPPAATATAPSPAAVRAPQIIAPWEAVARDGRDFAEHGAGMMYWFKVPLGGICYPEGFRNFLEPALENPRIRKIRFVLDTANPATRQTWDEMVVPLLEDWAARTDRRCTARPVESGGCFTFDTSPETTVSWIFDDLTGEVTPTFKFMVSDPDTNELSPQEAQIFLATAARRVRFRDGTQHTIRVPDTIIRVHEDDDRALLMALNTVANQWDTLF